MKKVAFITGGAGYIGTATAITLARAGIAVAVGDINREAVDKVVNQIRENGGEAIGLVYDVTNSAEVNEAVDETVKAFGRLDIMVHVAGGSARLAGPGKYAQLVDQEDEVIDKVEEYLDGDWEVPYATGGDIGRVIDYASGRNRYVGYLISLATCSYRGVKVGLDCSNGSTWQIAKSVFDALGADTYVINNSPDGLNVNLNCGSTHIEGLQQLVKEKGLDVGFAFDGDADRCLAVDENGEIVNGDKIMYVCARYMKEQGMFGDSKLVTTVMSNFGLYKALDKLGIEYEKTAVGDKYVYENMVRNDHLLGGEQSGHIIFRKYATTGDGMLTAIKLMECILEQKRSLSDLCAPVTMYPQVLKNVIVDDKDGTLADEAVQAAVKKAEEELGDGGRVLLRKSGTEPLLRVMAEAQTPEECEAKVDAIIDAMRINGHLQRVK
ncbi:MAG: SDR family NAD(P)-dependent oxidoreductase [Oscillospiraceae bacterium]|nr:SDR family NAD(P)-dependent oxidoreductase [Oscillospiraceae bacterium]